MRVLLVSKACVVGPYQKKLEAIASHQGVELRAVVPPYWKTEGGRLELRRMHEGGYELRVRRALFNGRFHLHFYPALGAEIAEFRPDLVHMDEEPYNLATAHGVLAGRRRGALCLFFSWQNLLRRYPPPFSWFERLCYRECSAIAGSADAASVLRLKGFRGALAEIPQFGVDPGLFSPAPSLRVGLPFTVGFAGRLVEEKGLEVLLKSFSSLGGNTQLRIAGSGPRRAWIQSYVARHRLFDRVRLEGHVAPEAMPDFMRSLDVLVMPSLVTPHWVEQFGRSLVEAMSCEVPVVASRSGEMPNVVGDCGLLTPPGDVEGLASALESLRADPEGRREYGRRGRRRVLERYTHERIAADTVGFYRRIVEDR